MEIENPDGPLDYRAMLCAMLGLDPATASDNDIKTALQEIVDGADPAAMQHGQPGLEEASALSVDYRELLCRALSCLEPGTAGTDSRLDHDGNIFKRLVALMADTHFSEAQEEVNRRLGISHEDFVKHIAGCNDTRFAEEVALSARAHSGAREAVKALSRGEDWLSPEQQEVNGKLGISRELFAKHGV